MSSKDNWPLAIDRRDFLNGTLVGAGAALAGASSPVAAAKYLSGKQNDLWTGYGGVGDYAASNGNTEAVRQSAHLIRDGLSPDLTAKAIDTGEEYDMIVVGGGFSGIGAAYALHKKHGSAKRCLILENHAVFGGEAKQNVFEVDGYTLYGPQGSNAFVVPPQHDDNLISDIFRTVGLPFDYRFVTPDTSITRIKTPIDSYESMFKGERVVDKGYFIQDGGRNYWLNNPWSDNLARLPWTEQDKRDLQQACKVKPISRSPEFDRWLDSMTYKDYLEKELGLSPAVTKFADPLVATSFWGVGADAISAYGVSMTGNPGFVTQSLDKSRGWYSFPGGNTGIYRHIVKYLLPESITGDNAFENILNNPINFAALDKPDRFLNIRLNSTVIDVRHEGDADSAKSVAIIYVNNGGVYRVRAKSVVMSVGGWVARNILSDMPAPIESAYKAFHHGPVLVVNVALRNWQFLEKLGISSGRWFKGFGSFFSIRRPMDVGKSTQPFDPSKPTVMTFYVSFDYSGHPAKVQGAMGRAELLSKSYADYEREIIEQMTLMFAMAGFNASRDVAGIVLNRWGHALVAAQPGFYFGVDGKPAPKEVIKQGYGRISFGHSELDGFMGYTTAIKEASRAAHQAMQWL